MNALFSNIHFLRPAWLTLLPVVVAVWWLWQRHSDGLRGWRGQIAPKLLEPLVVGRDARANWRLCWLLAGWIIAVIAIAGPAWRLEPNPFAADAQPLMILLKADQSMELAPPEPSRMERAHLKIADLAKLRKGQPLGLIAYAGSAHLVLPPTRDTDVVAKMASEVTPEIMPKPGDRLDLAIEQAAKLLSEQQQGGAILVVADSAELDGQTVTRLNELDQSFPIQFLALVDEGSPETTSVQKLARSLHASMEQLAVNDDDINAIVDFAERRASSGIAGESSRWQEAGYWLTPVLALIVALSFRRQKLSSEEGQP